MATNPPTSTVKHSFAVVCTYLCSKHLHSHLHTLEPCDQSSCHKLSWSIPSKSRVIQNHGPWPIKYGSWSPKSRHPGASEADWFPPRRSKNPRDVEKHQENAGPSAWKPWETMQKTDPWRSFFGWVKKGWGHNGIHGSYSIGAWVFADFRSKKLQMFNHILM